MGSKSRIFIITTCLICYFVTTTLTATLLFSSKTDSYDDDVKTLVSDITDKKTVSSNTAVFDNVKRNFLSKMVGYGNVNMKYPSNVHTFHMQKSGKTSSVFLEKYSSKSQRKNWPFSVGRVVDCGKQEENFAIYWHPGDLSPNGTLTFIYYYTAAHDFSSGMLVSELYFAEFPDEAIFEDSWAIDCNDFKGIIPCPVKEKQIIWGMYKADRILQKLEGFEGNYILKVTISNEDGEEMICGLMNVRVLT